MRLEILDTPPPLMRCLYSKDEAIPDPNFRCISEMVSRRTKDLLALRYGLAPLLASLR